MTIIKDAKEQVCRSLLNRVSYYDDLLAECDLKKDKEKVETIYKYRSNLLNRLELVVTH